MSTACLRLLGSDHVSPCKSQCKSYGKILFIKLPAVAQIVGSNSTGGHSVKFKHIFGGQRNIEVGRVTASLGFNFNLTLT